MHLCRFTYLPEHVECSLCTKRSACKEARIRHACPWLKERLEAGVVSYAELMLSLLQHPSCPASCKRISDLIQSYPGSMICRDSHLLGFQWLKSNIPLDQWGTNLNLAIAYLLSSSPILSGYARECIHANVYHRPMRFEVKKLQPGKIKIMKAVYALIGQSEPLALDDLLGDDADMATSRIIAHALLIARYGLDVLKVEE